MGLLECASGASVWRGYDYYKQKKVKEYEFLEDTRIMGIVSGGQLYTTVVDIAHPRKSTCNCPHADGKRIVCKHMIATYFAAFPEKAEEFYEDVMRAQEEETERQEELEDELQNYISHMTKVQLQEALMDLLYSGPEWQFDRFIRDYLEERNLH